MPPKRSKQCVADDGGGVSYATPLIGREAEFQTITNYVMERLAGSRGDILFISGACGCGKTSTVTRAEAWIRSLPTTQRAFVDYTKNLDPNANALLRHPLAPVNVKWVYVNCSGLTRDGAIEAILSAVACDADFALQLFRHLGEMLAASTGNASRSAKVSTRCCETENPLASIAGGMFRKFAVSKSTGTGCVLKQHKGKLKPFFAFALDEAEFTDASSYGLLSAFSSAALEFGDRMSLVLVSNARSLSFLPLNLPGRRTVTELVFEGYSIDALKAATRSHFEEKMKQKQFFGGIFEGVENIDAILAPTALDYAVKTSVNLHSGDLRKAIALCSNAIAAVAERRKEAKRQAACLEEQRRDEEKSGNQRRRTKREREETDSAQPSRSVSHGPPLATRVTLQTMLSSISDLNSSLDQIRTFPPYTRQLLKSFVDCVQRSGGGGLSGCYTYSFTPATLQAELWKRADELRIPKPSAASVIEALEDLRGMGFVTASSTSTKTQKLYTLAWSLAELQPKLANVPGFI